MASAAVTSESQASDADQPKLSDLIDNGWKLYEEVESTNEPTSSLPIQVKIKRGVSKLEEATRMVAQLDLFRVFGAGYPSLPTMTVNDWYEQHRRQGALPDQGIPKSAADLDNEEREEEEKERQIGNDNEEALQRARDWDNWKDTHRRGYGNRKNMG
ncbi:UNVERIFIED_CONTAM: hypothetical protein FKN15_022559 [Acipenser sinensis]